MNHVPVALGYRNTFGPDDRWRSTVGRERHVASGWCMRFWSRSIYSCDLLWWLLIAQCNKHLKRLSGVCFVTQSSQMSSSKRVGDREVNSDGVGPDENNKAEAEPPTVTANPQRNLGKTFCRGGVNLDILVFSAGFNIRLLAAIKTWSLDATFKIVPQWYQQLFTIHAIVPGKLMPEVYCSCTGKHIDTYPNIVNLVDDNLLVY
ncbi:hypothetical protein T11_16004 [Trichinella zimbabwensis]|uniref:Uncharacterized protein n=1 Tax=Trichinella zimbabwensis TaxID=268475 RepID=A0A0V1GLJ8_9BILA|nr:hypothetical protein T11_16004 [Trichinella zimbabwensis]